jgi:hypothetical protein
VACGHLLYDPQFYFILITFQFFNGKQIIVFSYQSFYLFEKKKEEKKERRRGKMARGYIVMKLLGGRATVI